MLTLIPHKNMCSIFPTVVRYLHQGTPRPIPILDNLRKAGGLGLNNDRVLTSGAAGA